jgi:Tol biopolymer transport system component
VDRAGVRKALNIPPANYSQPRISPDGKQLALYSDDGKVSDVSIYDMTGETPMRRLTFGGHNIKPVWTRDGQRIVFTSDREGDDALFWQRADGNGTAELLAKAEPGTSPQSESWSADDKTLLVNIRVGGRGSGLSTVTLGTDQKLKPFISQGGNATISYDGRWIAYTFNGGTTQNVYVEPFPPTGAKYQITTSGGNNPVWTRDGKQLFYMTLEGRQIMAVDILQTQPSFKFGKTTPLPIEGIVSVGPRPYDIMPDGKSFIAMFPPGDQNARKDAPDQINITLNWFEELKKLVPVR